MARRTHDNWLMAAEHIGGGAPKSIDELDSPAWQGYDVLTHTPPEKEWTKALHDHGIRCMPYLNLGYEDSADCAPGEAPECAVIDQLGRPRIQPNYFKRDGRMIYESCHNTAHARGLYLKRAEKIMKCGADGLFLDNAGPACRCWGPKFGKHEHLYANDPQARAEGHRPFCMSKAMRRYNLEVPIADPEQNYATAMLIGELRDLVRSFGADNRLMTNGGDGSSMPPLFFDQVDSVMNEMFIYTTYLDYNLAAPTAMDYQDHDVLDWLSVLEWEEPFQAKGVRMANLPAFSTHDPCRKRHAFYAFCLSKLWDGLFYTTNDDETGVWLRQFRLGAPLSDKPGNWGAVLYREFEGGLVAANVYGVGQLADVPWTDKPLDAVVYEDHQSLNVTEKRLRPTGDGTVSAKLFPDRAMLIVPAT